jgi:hypothetical protein|tara:strand:- start:115 stop:360 length:246 start_codon:yes stop_codon:yes gene_type:complete
MKKCKVYLKNKAGMEHGVEIWDYKDKYDAVGKAVLLFPHLYCRVVSIKENGKTENLEYIHNPKGKNKFISAILPEPNKEIK